MENQKTFRSLDELAKLLPETERSSPEQAPAPGKPQHDGKGKTVRILLDAKGRKGKSVTVVQGLQHNPQTMEMIARLLKQQCGAGGTVKEGTIEIQGDNREKVAEVMRGMNYVVKL